MSGILGGIAGNLAGGNIGRAVVSLVLDTTGYNSQLAKAEGETASATTGMAGGFEAFKLAGVAAAGVAGVALIKFSQDAVKAASDQQESLNKARVVFGAASSDVEAFAQTSAESFGISEQAALEASASFGNMLESAGIAQDQAGQMSTAIVQLAADLASFNNVDPAVALERLRSGLSGQARPLRAFGILLSESSVQEEAYASGIAKTGAALTEGEKVQARYNLILKQTGTAQGDFARTSDGLANRQRILRAEWEDMQAQVGEKLLPVIEELVPVIGDLAQDLIPLLATAIESLVPPLQAATETAKGLHDILGLLHGDIPDNFWQSGIDGAQTFTQVLGGFKAPADAANAAVAEQVQQILDLVPALDQATQAQVLAKIQAGDLAGALTLAKDPTVALGDATDDTARSQQSLAQQTRKATQALQDQRLAQLQAAGGLLGLVSSLQQAKDDQAALNKLQRQGKTDTAAYRDAVVQATTDQLSFRTAVRQYIADNPNRSLSQTRDVLREMATQAGITGKQFRDALGGSLKEVIGLADDLAHKRISIQVDTSSIDAAAQKLHGLEQAMARGL